MVNSALNAFENDLFLTTYKSIPHLCQTLLVALATNSDDAAESDKEQTLHDLVREFKATGSAYQQEVHEKIRTSYGNHYRRMLAVILDALRRAIANVVNAILRVRLPEIWG